MIRIKEKMAIKDMPRVRRPMGGEISERMEEIYNGRKEAIPSTRDLIRKDPALAGEWLKSSKTRKEEFIAMIENLKEPPSTPVKVREAVLAAVLSGMNLGIMDAVIAKVVGALPVMLEGGKREGEEGDAPSVGEQLRDLLNSDAREYIERFKDMTPEESDDLVVQIKELSKDTARNLEKAVGQPKLKDYQLDLAQIFLDFYNIGLLATHSVLGGGGMSKSSSNSSS